MKISINLLPPELITKELKKANFYKIQLAGIVIILTMVFLASLSVALRILQSRSILSIQARVTEARQKVSDLKDTQAAIMILKSRLAVVDKYWGESTNQTLMYKLMGKIIPEDITVNTITIDQKGDVSLTALVSDTLSLDNFIEKLTDKDSNEGRVSQVSIENLNRSRDGLYRVGIIIKSK
ncbi:hypothetical protein A3J19_01760 [Candidatus Daviesbacteria bacterium RIFCSPLOWO2_02_FULL_41_8]|uniref:Fimbrial assembly protein n=3 Tax=Candidatus Daviesiibacteriota TaxID=1752718 RepID=A0A1F5NHT6_9BACT|nr:MAG: hypothetical protein A2871_00980 [Candidatus Daviesbacteria bacterium RIFCSPHIGHO2_01_FULL_41_23]OGE32952.1 MAG: hypothetical protein A3D83_04785 [Candidatus Daviesbacteria bacterium RIFCSPHIGHO2_02_FULL_41_10]OGE62468.1 MAG: hypothetical protein A2967_01465 [Candidatus Daviesbacteria bacterium RIFCSPLOWO2_01_FULL_41_32]OGE77188.1 MAG: hypothetical protein A3J19_01760 [Candidatus Daviesbacteria bacterium RIFCSPLOWO2_02_FULL_41_8]